MICAALQSETDIAGFFARAAEALRRRVPPQDILWRVGAAAEGDLFAPEGEPDLGTAVWRGEPVFALALLHRDPRRFALLYRLLHRLSGNPDLGSVASDRDVAALRDLEKSVRRDVHKMRAFLRFRRIEDEAGERFLAWFEPEHHIAEHNAGFFVRRFANMRWSIITPDVSLHYDGATLATGPGGRRRDVPAEDALEEAWKTYFTAIFNPARLMVSAMLREMPKKYWRNMPETALVKPLIAGAARRAVAMIDAAPTPARKASPVTHEPEPAADYSTPEGLNRAIRSCRRCPLHQFATQAVPGEGPAAAELMIVAEQPGDNEDIAGRPLIGPAGRVFDEALKRVGIERSGAFITNAVKHFKFTPRGKARIHAKPNAGEIAHCRWWLDREIAQVRPRLIVAMGATAAGALLGEAVAIREARGRILHLGDGTALLTTVHPAYMLRLRERAEKIAAWRLFLADLAAAKAFLATPEAAVTPVPRPE